MSDLSRWVVAACVYLAACEPSQDLMVDADCAMGFVETCTGRNGCPGERECEGPVGHWGLCECEPTFDDAGVDAGSTTLPRLGAECSDDGLCPAGAYCLTPNDLHYFGGGPPTGTCVADCSTDSSVCEAFGATCVNVALSSTGSVDALDGGTDDAGSEGDPDRVALCMERCTVGDGSAECHARADVACEAIEAPSRAGYCRPLCMDDGECDAARVCNPKYGVCATERASNARLGSECGLPGSPSCGGQCVELAPSYRLCAAPCAFGNPGACGLGNNGTAGGCVLASEGGTIGDLGYCAELCDCDADCSHPNGICDGFTSDTLRMVFGREGACTAPDLAVGTSPSCD